MDKNNDIQVNKVDKWEAAPVSIKNLRNYILESWKNYAAPSCCPPLDPSDQDSICESMSQLLEFVLDDYNELEARHQKDTGMISEYEEENKKLKSELDIKTDECDALISRVFKQDDEYAILEAKNKEIRETDEFHMRIHRKVQDEYNRIATENEELRSKCESKEDALKKMIHEVAELEKEKIDLEVQLAQSDELRYRAAKYAWAIKTVLKKASYSPGHVAEELRYMAKKSTTPNDVFERWEGIADELLGEHSKLVDKINRLEKKNEELEKALNDKKFTTWEEIERKLFAPAEIVESQLRVERMADEIERLKKENNNLTTDTKRLSDAVEAWFNMFNDMRHKRDFLKKEYEKLKETNKSLRRTVRILDGEGYF